MLVSQTLSPYLSYDVRKNKIKIWKFWGGVHRFWSIFGDQVLVLHDIYIYIYTSMNILVEINNRLRCTNVRYLLAGIISQHYIHYYYNWESIFVWTNSSFFFFWAQVFEISYLYVFVSLIALWSRRKYIEESFPTSLSLYLSNFSFLSLFNSL